MKRNLSGLIIGLLGTLLLVGCSDEPMALTNEQNYTLEIPEADQPAKPPIAQVYTTDKKMALTFNGLADENTMDKILSELKKQDIHATFFLQGSAVSKNPALAGRILDEGHEVQNNTLNHVLPEQLSYEEAYREMKLANQILEDQLGIEVSYVRSRSGDSAPDFELAAAQLDTQVVTYTINPQDGNGQSAKEIADYVAKFMNRGAIIELNTYLNPAIAEAVSLIAEQAEGQGYALTTLSEVMSTTYKSEEEIKTNELAVNKIENPSPKIIKRFETDQKEIVLTFDDWASDQTVSSVLDILKENDIKATFFLIGKGVEQNPPLARELINQGHEVASHTFSHTVVTTLSDEDLQNDIVHNDQVLTDALQQAPVNYFRPPQGILDNKSARSIAATGIDYIILYDVATMDWNKELTEQEVLNRVMERTVPGSILTMHISDKAHTVSVLPKIIAYYKERGYSFKTVSEMIEKE